jgi:hypothetical protein
MSIPRVILCVVIGLALFYLALFALGVAGAYFYTPVYHQSTPAPSLSGLGIP